MQHAQQFFEGLTGPASLTFLGLLLVAFLIGALPTAFANAARARKLRRRLARRDDALAEARATIDQLTADVERAAAERASVATETADLRQRLSRAIAERQASGAEVTRLREEGERQRDGQLATQIEAQENAKEVQVLRGRIDALNAQLQGLRQASQARRAPAGAFDVNVVASLQAARTKADALEARLAQVTADNEALRRQLS